MAWPKNIQFYPVPALGWVFLGIAIANHDWFYLIISILMFALNYAKTGDIFKERGNG